MGFPEQRRAMVDRAFATFGVAADWDGTPVTVRLRGQDEEGRYGQVSLVRREITLRVRSWQIVQPAKGQVVTITEGPQAGRYEIGRGSMMDVKGVWDCPAQMLS